MSESNKPDTSKEPEIRYVPVQFIEGYTPQSANDEVEIDLIDILKRIWDGRATIIRITAVFAVIGLLYALGSPNEYTTTTKLLPEVQQTNNLGRLGGLAAQFGLGGAAGGATNDILPPQIYPEILTSTDFLYQIIKRKVYYEELQDSITIQQFYNEHQSPNYFISYTLGLPFRILRIFRNQEELPLEKEENLANYRRLSVFEQSAIGSLRMALNLNRDQQSGIIGITTTTQKPEVTVQVSKITSDLLSKFLINYRTEKAKESLLFLEQRFLDAKNNFEAEQTRLAVFRDQNLGNLTASARTTEQNILSEYNVKLNVYNSISEQLEQARIKLQQDTPVVTIIQDSIYPNIPSSPRRLITLVIFGLLGIIIGIIYVVSKDTMKSILSIQK